MTDMATALADVLRGLLKLEPVCFHSCGNYHHAPSSCPIGRARTTLADFEMLSLETEAER